jgi:mevalonate kinase
MGGIGRAHGKLILFGEHSAVYGHPAIGVSLPESLTVRLGRAPLADWDLQSIPSDDRPGLLSVLARLEARLPELARVGRCSVHIASRVARGVGYGSSAALCAALSLALLSRERGNAGGALDVSEAPEMDEAWGLAHDAEQVFHGTPSGIDTGLSLLGGLVSFQPRPPALPEWRRLPGARLWLVTAAVPRDESCAALIKGLGGRMQAGDRVVQDAIAELGRIARSVQEALDAGSSPSLGEQFGQAADGAMEVLKSIGLGNPSMERLIAAGKSAGARGGKLSGAGGGGAFYLVADSRRAAGSISGALRAAATGAGITLAAPVRMLGLS